MAAKQWSVTIDGKSHAIRLTHGWVSGIREIYVDDRLIEKTQIHMDGGSAHKFEIDGHPIEIFIEVSALFFTFDYLLFVDGVDVDRGRPIRPPRILPFWAVLPMLALMAAVPIPFCASFIQIQNGMISDLPSGLAVATIMLCVIASVGLVICVNAVKNTARPTSNRVMISTGIVGMVCLITYLIATGLNLMRPTFVPRAVIVLAPSTTATVTDNSLLEARDVLQKRLEVADIESRVTVEGEQLRVELKDGSTLEMVREISTGVGELVFWDSEIPVEIGSPTPDDAEVILTDLDIAAAAPGIQADVLMGVNVVFTPDGSKKLADYSSSHIGHYLVISRDGVVLISPEVTSALRGGMAVIEGDFDTKSAFIFSVQLSGGRLPFPLIVVSEN